MSNELEIVNETGKSMAELMGFSSKTSNAEFLPTISRLKLLHNPIMGINDKGKKEEVLPIGAFMLKTGDDIVYSTGVTIRAFVQRNQWQRWNGETGEMEKSVMSDSLNGDLKDSVGGFNLGRPSGYMDKEAYAALPESTKAVIKSVSRVVVYYGTVTLDNPMNENGEALAAVESVPFVMDVKNRDSLKSINGVISSLKRKNILPVMHNIKLEGTEESTAQGMKFAAIQATLGESLEFVSSDQEVVKDFLELIQYNNGKILDLYHERAKGNSDEDAELVGEILNNDFVEVAE